MNVVILAGGVSSLIFATSTLPMLIKAYRTKDLSSYSLGYIAMNNLGNLIYSIYIFNLPFGPIWFLHSFNLVTTALMLYWYLRYEKNLDIFKYGVLQSHIQQRRKYESN